MPTKSQRQQAQLCDSTSRGQQGFLREQEAQEEEPVRWVQALGPGAVSDMGTKTVPGAVARVWRPSTQEKEESQLGHQQS